MRTSSEKISRHNQDASSSDRNKAGSNVNASDEMLDTDTNNEIKTVS